MTVIFQNALEVDELGHKGRNQTKENKRETDLKDYLDCECIRIDTDEQDFSAYDKLGKVQTFTDKSKEKKKKIIQKRNKRIKRRKKRIKRTSKITQKINKRTKRRNQRIQRRTKRTKRQR